MIVPFDNGVGEFFPQKKEVVCYSCIKLAGHTLCKLGPLGQLVFFLAAECYRISCRNGKRKANEIIVMPNSTFIMFIGNVTVWALLER